MEFWFLNAFRTQAPQKFFTGSMDNEKCNTWDIEVTTIPRHVKLQHIYGIANTSADSVPRLKAVGIYHDLDLQKSQPDSGTPFELLPTIEWAIHLPRVVHEISIENNLETLEKQVTTSQTDYHYLPLEEDAPHLEQKLMSLPELTPDKINLLQQKDTFCNNIITQLHCNPHDKYFTDSMGILNKRVVDFNSTFSSVVVSEVLIKYMLHASHDSLAHVGAIKLYYFTKKALLLPRHEESNA